MGIHPLHYFAIHNNMRSPTFLSTAMGALLNEFFYDLKSAMALGGRATLSDAGAFYAQV
jgi:hypothetical protein